MEPSEGIIETTKTLTWEKFLSIRALSGTHWDVAILTSHIFYNEITYQGGQWCLLKEKSIIVNKDAVFWVVIANLNYLCDRLLKERKAAGDKAINNKKYNKLKALTKKVKSVDFIKQVIYVFKFVLFLYQQKQDK